MSQKRQPEVEKPVKAKRRKDQKVGDENPLSLRKIEKLIIKSKTYIGSIFSDSFTNLLIKAKTFSLIVHCNNHWFCIYSTPETFEIFDPLGFLQKADCINSIFISFLKSQLGRKVLYANPKLQSSSSFACGYFVSFFILNRESGLTFNEILSKFSRNYKKNELLVKLFFKNKVSN